MSPIVSRATPGARGESEHRGGAEDDDWIADDETAAEVPRDADSTCPQVSVSYPPNVKAFTHPELDYAIAELVENALEHGQSTPRVRIDVRATDETIEVSIRDNFPPIPVEERYVITDRWEMDDLRHTGGMGLWLVYWVANRSGGDLTFDTHADGNIVTLTVPNAKAGTSTEEPHETSLSNRPKTDAAERADTRMRTDGSVPPEPERNEDTSGTDEWS